MQNDADGGTKNTCWEFLLTSKRPFGYKQKTFRLQAKDLSLLSKSFCFQGLTIAIGWEPSVIFFTKGKEFLPDVVDDHKKACTYEHGNILDNGRRKLPIL